MKTTIFFFIAFFVLASQMVNAQSKSDKMYDVLSGKDGVTNFSFSKNMIDAIDIDLGEDGNEQKVTGDLQQVRFMSYNPKKGSLSGTEFTEKAISYLPKTAYKKYEGEDPDDDAEIWLQGGKRKFQECHVFIKNQQEGQLRIVVSFYGDFTVNDLEGLKKTSEGFTE